MADVLNDGRLPGCPGFATTSVKSVNIILFTLLAETSYVVMRCRCLALDVDGGSVCHSPGTVVRPEHVAPKRRAHRALRSQPNLSRSPRTHNLLSSTQHGGPIPEDTFHDDGANLRAVSVPEFALVLQKT